MKHVITAVLIGGLATIGAVGCSKVEKSTAKQETKISTPGGTTTITTEKEVKKTGEKPPG
jgi:hypothetical protein